MAGSAFSESDWLCINTLRTLSIDAIQKANSGHPGLPLGAAPMAYVLWQNHLKVNPKAPDWPDRDRFVLSAGHGSALLYSLLHCYGFDLSMEDLKAFRQWQSKTPGHPEAFLTPGIDATTGPLGQGFGNAVGMAIAERALAHRFGDKGLMDHFTYVLCGDGDLMEGISAEAASLAGHLSLGRLICLYDANDICLDGPISMTFTENVEKRFEAHGWQVLTVQDGDKDLAAIDQAITDAKAETQKPTMIIVKTTIGYGSPNKAGTSSVHGSPLGQAELEATKKALGWQSTESFSAPQEALSHMREAMGRGTQAYDTWENAVMALEKDAPSLHQDWQRALAKGLPADLAADLPQWADGSVATRSAGGEVLNALAAKLPELMGGDADLSCSTKTAIKNGGTFEGQTGEGRNIHFGVREHAMGAIACGMAYHGGLRPYTATFFCFADYMRPAIRIAALNHLPVIFLFTHDSIGLGEDGPTHQPVEHLMSLRTMPGLHTLRPADANETREAWLYALERSDGPTAIVMSRQDLPMLETLSAGASAATAQGVTQGAYVVLETDNADLTFLATGSEVSLALQSAELLAKDGKKARVVSMPSWEAFLAQPEDYQDKVLGSAPCVSVEAGVTLGWQRFVGRDGLCLGVDSFGASAPAEILFEEYGLSVEKVRQSVLEKI